MVQFFCLTVHTDNYSYNQNIKIFSMSRDNNCPFTPVSALL